ncbi:hypothetical protein ACTXT7_016101 [Hymenolepis weldensis]
MKSIARGYAYKPGMDEDIEYLVRQCSKWKELVSPRSRAMAIGSDYMLTSRARSSEINDRSNTSEPVHTTLSQMNRQKDSSIGKWEAYKKVKEKGTMEEVLQNFLLE